MNTMKRLIFCDVESIEGPTVTLFSAATGRKFDLIKVDFPWAVKKGDRVCMAGGFIHSKVPAGIMPKDYIDGLVRALR